MTIPPVPSQWRHAMENWSRKPLFNAAVSKLALGADYANGIVIANIQVPPTAMQYGPLQVCYAIIPKHCLVALEIIEYDSDRQCSGDIPFSYSTIYKGLNGIYTLHNALKLLKQGERQDYDGSTKIRRPLKKLHVWIGAGQKDGPFFDSKKAILADNLSITATFR